MWTEATAARIRVMVSKLIENSLAKMTHTLHGGKALLCQTEVEGEGKQPDSLMPRSPGGRSVVIRWTPELVWGVSVF